MKHKMVECGLGFPLAEKQARALDQILKSLPKDCTYRKAQSVASIELKPGERADISLISSNALDRDNEVLIPKGMRLDLFQQNPVVMMAHDYSALPVGKCQWIKRDSEGIKAKTIYPEKPDGWEGQWMPDAVWHLVKEGVLRGKSVGFLPTKLRAPTQQEIKANPSWERANCVIEESILLEFSIAPIPVNPEALTIAVAKGLISEAIAQRLGLSVPAKPKKKVADLNTLITKAITEAWQEFASRGRV
jgi:phage head maturation protease